MSGRADTLSTRLLDAHVAHVLDSLRGEALVATLDRLLDDALAIAADVTLEEAVTRDIIKATAHTYAIEFELRGAIPEIVGDIARAIYAHEAHAETTLGTLVSTDTFAQFVDKALELRDLRRWLVHELVTQPAYAAFATEVLVVALRGVIRRRAPLRNLRLPGPLGGLVESVLASEAAERLDDALDEALHAFVRDNLEWILARSERFLLDHVDEPRLRELALRLWDELQTRRIKEALATVTDRDVEELFVLGFEAFKRLRETDYYRAMIDAGIDGVFDKYGDVALVELLEELGVDRPVMRREGIRFGPAVLGMLDRRGLLEALVRQQLEPFYRSGAVAAVLAEFRKGEDTA